MSTTEVCLRCGDFLAPDGRALEGLALCRPCFAPRTPLRDPPVVTPPAGIYVFVIALVLGTAAVFALGGWLVSPSFGLDGIRSAAIGAGLAAFVLSLPPVRDPVEALVDRAWRRETLGRLGLAATSLADQPFVYWKDRRRGLKDTGSPADVGLFVEAGDSLLILGRRGGRRAIPVREVANVELVSELLVTGAPLCVRIDVAAGPWAWISVRGGWTRWANQSATRALEARLRAKIEAARRPPPP